MTPVEAATRKGQQQFRDRQHQGHGCSPQPRNRGTPNGRTYRRHRSHPTGGTLHGPPIHHPRTRIMILERPWAPRHETPGDNRPPTRITPVHWK